MSLRTRTLDWLNRHGKAFAVRVRGVHPKHLVEVKGHAWYLEHIQNGDLVLDVGSGTGRHADRIVVERKAWVDMRDRPEFDAEQPWKMGHERYDVVLMLDVLEHLHQRAHALSEAYRVLKPGGRLLLAVPNRETTWRRQLREAGLFSYSDPDHKWEYTHQEIADEIRKAGFFVMSVSPATYDTPWAGVLDALGALYLPLYDVFSTWRHERVHGWRTSGGVSALGRSEGLDDRWAGDPGDPGESTGFRVVAVK